MYVAAVVPQNVLSGTGLFGLPVVRDLIARFTGRAGTEAKTA